MPPDGLKEQLEAGYQLIDRKGITAAGKTVTVPTGVGDDSDADSAVNGICAVLAPAAGELPADTVIVTGDAADGSTVELGRC